MNQFPINHEYYNIIFNLWEEKPVTAFSLAQLLYNNIHLSLPSMFWFQCFPFANCLFGVRTNTFTHHCFGDSFRFLSVISLLLTERKHKTAWNSPGSEWMASMGMWSQHSGFFLRLPSGWCLWLRLSPARRSGKVLRGLHPYTQQLYLPTRAAGEHRGHCHLGF